MGTSRWTGQIMIPKKVGIKGNKNIFFQEYWQDMLWRKLHLGDQDYTYVPQVMKHLITLITIWSLAPEGAPYFRLIWWPSLHAKHG